MRKRFDYNSPEFADIVASATSIASVARAIGITPRAGNYVTIKRHIFLQDLDTSHFTGQSWNKGNFAEHHKTNKYLKAALVRERGHECEECNLRDWRGVQITLELEHVDGDRSNNDSSNLKLLCPNCHSQTPTWRRGVIPVGLSPSRTCPSCKKEKQPRSRKCLECFKMDRVKK